MSVVINDVPKAVLQNGIFSKLDLKDLANASAVNKLWHDAVQRKLEIAKTEMLEKRKAERVARRVAKELADWGLLSTLVP